VVRAAAAVVPALVRADRAEQKFGRFDFVTRALVARVIFVRGLFLRFLFFFVFFSLSFLNDAFCGAAGYQSLGYAARVICIDGPSGFLSLFRSFAACSARVRPDCPDCDPALRLLDQSGFVDAGT
jgi:hypothetical protein